MRGLTAGEPWVLVLLLFSLKMTNVIEFRLLPTRLLEALV